MSKAERTRALIIEKTAPIFNKKGYAGTSLNDMTEATGLTKGSIYGNFANKDEVALAVFDYNLSKVNTALANDVARQNTAKDKLLVYVDDYERFLSAPFTAGGCPVLNTAVEADDTNPGLRKKAANALLAWKNKIVQIIEEGKSSREFSSDTDAEQIALTMIATIEGSIMIAKLLDQKHYIPKILQSIKKIIKELS